MNKQFKRTEPNPSARNTISNWLFRMVALITIVFNGSMFTVWGVTNEYGPDILETKCTPAAGQAIESVKTITFVFDCTKALTQYSELLTPSNSFISAIITTKKTVRLYRGTVEDGEILASAPKAMVDGTPGEPFSVTFELEKECFLLSGELYTIAWDKNVFCIGNDTTVPSGAYTADGSYSFYGATSSSSIFELLSFSPELSSPAIEDFSLQFSQDITLSPDATAHLYEGDTLLGETTLSVSSEDDKIVEGKFDLTPLYYSHNYMLAIDEGAIIEKNTGKSFDAIQLNYKGTAYKYFSYGRITPGNNRTLEYVGQITVPVNCSETEYLGRDFKAKANLNKLDDDELAVIKNNIECVVTENAQGFYVNVYDFNLEPSSTYQLVVDADQFCLWSYETEKPMRDTANEKLVLTYTTPDEIVPLPKQQFGTSTPSTDAAVESIESFKLMFEPYDFEDTFYYPVFSNYNVGYNVIDVVDQTTGDTIASFEVDIKWDDDNNYWLENIDALDITLLDGHSYNIAVPAGMFCCRFEPLHDLTLNDEYTITYQGAYKTSFAVNCNYGDAITLSNIVNRGEDATLKFNPSDEWDIDRVTVNYKEVEVSDNTLVVADVTEETNVYVAYRFVGGVTFDYTTGVESAVAECQYGISTDAGHVTITNITAGATVEVYNTVGMLMASSTATDSILTIGVNPGIVVVVIRDDADVPVAITVRVP